MRLLIVAAIAIVTGAFAGCIGGVETISAMDGLEPATDAAKALTNVTPQLVDVASLEPLRNYVDEDDDLEINVYLDKTPGDGLAPGWVYTYAAGDDILSIGYASGLGVIFDMRDGGELADEDVSEYVISGWKTDSDDAAAALAQHEMWPEMTPSSLLFWELMQGDECPVWYVEHFDAQDEDAITYAEVDGCTGEVTAVTTQDLGGFTCSNAYTSGSGYLIPTISSEMYMDLESGAYLNYVVDFGIGAGDVSWTLTGPEGTIDQGSESVNDGVTDVTGGTYTLSVVSGAGASQYSAMLEGGTC